MKRQIQKEPHPDEEITLVDFVDDYGGQTRGDSLLSLISSVVESARREVLEKGHWPKMTPDHVFVSRGNNNRQWEVRFDEFDSYSEAETCTESPHRIKIVRDATRLAFFLGTGEYPADLNPILDNRLQKKQYPQLSARLRRVLRKVLSENPGQRPGTLREVQELLEARKPRRHWIRGLVGISAAVALLGVAFLAKSEAEREEPAPPLAEVRSGPVEPSLNVEIVEEETASEPVLLPPKSDVLQTVAVADFPEAKRIDTELQAPPQVEINSMVEHHDALRGAHSSLEIDKRTMPVVELEVPEIETIAVETSTPKSELLENLGLAFLRERADKHGDQAIEWLEEARALGNSDATYLLAESYFFGKGTEIDQAKALELAREAEAAGNPRATAMLGTIYSKGEGVEQNFERARDYFRMAIERGAGEAYGNLGVLQLRGLGGKQSEFAAFESFQKGGESGDPVAAFYLAKCLESGIGTEINQSEATKWYVASASGGYDAAREWCRRNEIPFSVETAMKEVNG